MTIEEEPSYMAFARAAVKNNEGVPSIVVRELIARIDRDAIIVKEVML